MATIASSLEHKCKVELKNLKQKLRNQLQKDIFKIYKESIFTDIYIKVGINVLKLHRCMLQTRVPIFYHTYCSNPDLISVVLKQKLEIFFREIYCETDIKSKEEDIVKCIESAFFSTELSLPYQNCYYDRSHFYSLNNTNANNDNESNKLQSLKDITKVSTLNTTFSNYNYLRKSDNTNYYSLVDESLVLSDFSDINEETIKEMSGCKEHASSTEFMDMHEKMEEQKEITLDDKLTSKEEDFKNEIPAIIEHLKIGDLSCERRNINQNLCKRKENVRTTKTKYFKNTSVFNADNTENSSIKNEEKQNIEMKDQNKFFKCFIDASDLIDDDKTNAEKNEKLANSKILNTSIDSKTNHERIKVSCEKQTPDSLDDDPYQNDIEGTAVEYADANLKICNVETQRLQSKLQNDFLQANLQQNIIEQSTNDLSKKCDKSVVPISNEIVHNSDLIDKSVHLILDETIAQFKTYLVEKYECAKVNHIYSVNELQRLKNFDELIANDTQFLYLKYNLEELITTESLNKTNVAMNKFLIKQYEKGHRSEEVYSFVKTILINLLEKRNVDCEMKSNLQNSEQTIDLVNKERLQNTKVFCEPEDVKKDVDELFRILLKSLNTKQCKEKMKSCISESSNSSDPVTIKSCGFFINLKENNVKSTTHTETKEKSLPSKQLFSMFINFGNSTDSDSSTEIQNKFEKRKNQYINKLEKSRELRNSAGSLNDSGEGRKLEKIMQNSAKTCTVFSTEKTLKENQPTNVVCDDISPVIRRCKNSSPHPREMRRSWNVDKTSEINRNSVTKHKRSYSVSSRNENINDTSLCSVDINLNKGDDDKDEHPSIGNADSANEFTINGESEMSNTCSYSEWENDKKKYSDSLKTNETNEEKLNEKNFVKLSDMDKEPKTLLSSNNQWPSIRMTKSATGVETNWFETKLLNGSVNSRSLSRIFPDLSASVLSKPNSDVDDTTISSISSVQSSSVVSTCESNLEVSANGNKIDNNTLGQDLLRMFLEEISTDVVVEVAGRRIKAHKCILTSRCQYFAALLSGGWVESAGNVLSIQGFSYNVVHFALCYIYSGESEIPENINIVELATLADYLCLEGLKEIVSSTLKMKYCHFFHKPCNICSVGVLECLPIAVNYGLEDIHRKSLRWITKHYVRLWCSKAFATLPKELIDKCYNQHVVNMTVNNVFETLMNCDKLFSFIPQTRWAEPCFVVTKKLHDYSIKFLANNFIQFLNSDSFTSIASNRTWGIIIMDEKTQLVCNKMRSDQLCQSYASLCNEYKLATVSNKNEELIDLLSRVKHQVETALIKTALQASQCSAWFQMEPELRSHIQTSAGLTFVPSELKRRVDSFKPRCVSGSSRAADLQQVKSAINRQHKQSNIRSHEIKQTKPNSNQKQTNNHVKNISTKLNGVQNKENKESKNVVKNSKSPFRNKYANVKSRYMENKSNSKNDKTASETTPSETSEAEKKPIITNKRSSKSLASSINLSPALRHTVRAVSLSKIPISVRNTSQKRTESDKDTTSGSDNGVKSECIQKCVNGSAKRLTSSAIMIKSNIANNLPTKKLVNSNLKSREDRTPIRDNNLKSIRPSSRNRNAVVNNSSNSRCKSAINGASKRTGRCNNNKTVINNGDNSFDSGTYLKDSGPEMKCPSNPSGKSNLSEEINRPEIPFRRDGTFCIDEPTILKKHSPCSDHTNEII